MTSQLSRSCLLAACSCLTSLAIGQTPTEPAAPPTVDPKQDPKPAAKAQEPEVDPEIKVTVTAFRMRQDPFELSRSVTVVDENALRVRDQDSVLDALDNRMGLWVEKRTATTSDPIIRGLAGFNILALVDGDSLSTFWGEGGDGADDLYGKVDAESIERVEVIRGPASVEYGSNALGGVINFITRKPRLGFTESGAVFGGRVKAGYDTVNDGITTRLDGEFATRQLRMRLGGTFRDLDDGKGGGNVGDLVPSGGEELNFDLNSEVKLDDGKGMLFFNAQRVRRENIMRYYRPTQSNENDRDAFSFGYRSATDGSDEGLEARIYWQDKEDRRYWDDGSWGVAKWETLSTDWSWRTRQWQDHSFVAGFTARLDQGESPGDEQFTMYTPTGSVSKPAPDQDWYNVGLFAHDDWNFAPQWTLSTGVRFDRFYYDATPDQFYNPTIGDPSIDDIETWESAFTGGLGLTYAPNDAWRLFGSWTRGYRMNAPVFGISEIGLGVLVPSGSLEPTTGDNFELGVRHRSALLDCSLVGYHTLFDGFQRLTPTTYNGSSTYLLNGTNQDVWTYTASGTAYVQGIEFESRVELNELWETLPLGSYLAGGFMWNEGEDESKNVPLRRTHPMRGLVAIGYEEPFEGRWNIEFGADMVDRYSDIDPDVLAGDLSYRSDPQNRNSPLIRDYGLPGYTTYYLRGSARVSDRTRCGIHIDNLSDKNYRSAHSRMDAFGFNLGLWVEFTF